MSLCLFVLLALLPHSNGSDCGYCSSMEGSETGSREGSDVACTEGMCNHDETGMEINVVNTEESLLLLLISMG